MEAKRRLRRELQAAVSRLSPAEKSAAADQLCRRIALQEAWQRAQTLLFFASRPEEPQLVALLEKSLQQGKVAVFPRFLEETGQYAVARIDQPERDLQPGKFGILEPRPCCPGVEPKRLDLALVPGIGFDAKGRRLGRGKGFFDRLLATVPGLKCGVAFDCQVVLEVPMESHDIRMDYLATPSRWLVC